jgi:quercetin dioxygenase-like cupin family protein
MLLRPANPDLQYLRMQLHNWSQIEREQMNPHFARQVVHGDKVTVAKVYLVKGSSVARHSHENEQICMLVEGKLRFIFDDRDFILDGGNVLQISGNEPHGVEALEDSVAFDLFSPVREDWIRGDDAYLRTV